MATRRRTTKASPNQAIYRDPFQIDHDFLSSLVEGSVLVKLLIGLFVGLRYSIMKPEVFAVSLQANSYTHRRIPSKRRNVRCTEKTAFRAKRG